MKQNIPILWNTTQKFKNQTKDGYSILICNELQSILPSHSFMVGWICNDLFAHFTANTIQVISDTKTEQNTNPAKSQNMPFQAPCDHFSSTVEWKWNDRFKGYLHLKIEQNVSNCLLNVFTIFIFLPIVFQHSLLFTSEPYFGC